MNLKEKAQSAATELMTARKKAEQALIEIVKEHEGFIKTLPPDGDSFIKVTKCYDECGNDVDAELVDVYGIRLNEDEDGITLCTSDTITNYEFDNNVQVTLDNVEEIEKMLSQPEYFEDLEGTTFLMSTSLISLLSGVCDYL